MSNIKKVAVCGAGTMGRGIAIAVASAGFQTILYEKNEPVLQSAHLEIIDLANQWLDKNRISEKQHHGLLKNIVYTNSIETCIADIIIEAIYENEEAKKELYQQLNHLNGSGAILVSNTSSLSVNTLANHVSSPGQFAGMHFFNPAYAMKLVELVKGNQTSEHTMEVLSTFTRALGKMPVNCVDAPGFIVNHVARPYYLEALWLHEHYGIAMEQVDKVLEATGFRMGPFKLMDLIGNDINYAVSCSVYEALGKPPALQPSALQQRKVEAGELGKKTGKGYYTY